MKDIPVNGLTKHIEEECNGNQLRCPSCKTNIFRMYKDIDKTGSAGEGHLCIRDLTQESDLLKNQLTQQEQNSESLENKIK